MRITPRQIGYYAETYLTGAEDNFAERMMMFDMTCTFNELLGTAKVTSKNGRSFTVPSEFSAVLDKSGVFMCVMDTDTLVKQYKTDKRTAPGQKDHIPRRKRKKWTEA